MSETNKSTDVNGLWEAVVMVLVDTYKEQGYVG